MPTVVLLGSLDTKGQEYEFLRNRLIGHGVDVVLIDFGVMGPPETPPDITAAEVAMAGGSSLEAIRTGGERGEAMAIMTVGVTAICRRLLDEGRLTARWRSGGPAGHRSPVRRSSPCP